MVFSCGTTSGASPKGSVAATRSSYVHMPATSAVRASGSTAMTSVSPEVSRPGALVFARDRNRFEVRLASRTGAVARDGPIALEKALHAGGVSGPCVGRGSGHASTLVRGRSGMKGFADRDKGLGFASTPSRLEIHVYDD